MARKPPGLLKRGQIWWIDKSVYGQRLRESTGSRDRTEAERYLAFRIEQARRSSVYGVPVQKTFEEAATRYLWENSHKRSIDRDGQGLKLVMPHIGHLLLSKVHMGTLQPFIDGRLQAGRSQGTINRDLAPVRRILNLAARLWRDENGNPWLVTAPLIQMRAYQARQPGPLSFTEQQQLFAALPKHLAQMALFKVNTGTRDHEVSNLRWDWEIRGHNAFLIPASFVKNQRDRLVVCNSIAMAVIESVRGEHSDRVFTYRGLPVARMYNTAWKRARTSAGLPHVRVHDLKHTFGHRLRAAGVSFEDIQDLLGHKSQRITRHYSAPDIDRLLLAAETVVELRQDPTLRLVRGSARHNFHTERSILATHDAISA
jgi:integrase